MAMAAMLWLAALHAGAQQQQQQQQPLTPEGYPYGVPHPPGVRGGGQTGESYGGPANNNGGGGGLSFFYPNYGYAAPYGYYTPYVSGYPPSPYTASPYNAGAYQATAAYGECYTDANGISLHNLVNWECHRYDGLTVPSGFCQPPPSVVSCN